MPRTKSKESVCQIEKGPGSGEEKYYLSLIDDYSRFSWLYVKVRHNV